MTDEKRPRGTDDVGKSDSDNAVFKDAIDNVFRKVAERRKKQAECAEPREHNADLRGGDAGDRQRGREPDH